MDAVSDFEDLLALLHRHKVRYLVIGGLAFIYHARPRYTKALPGLRSAWRSAAVPRSTPGR
jgi:hypothetical protein